LLAERDLPLRVIDHQAFIDFLGPQDEPWLRVLVDEMLRFEGRPWRELVERMAEPLPCLAPPFKRRAATRVLGRLWHRDRVAPLPPREVRARVFGAAAARAAPAAAVLEETAGAFGVTAEVLSACLFADLPGERRVRAPVPLPTTTDLRLRTNLAVAQAVLMRSSRLTLEFEGRVRPVVRLAKLQGLLCAMKAPAPTASSSPSSATAMAAAPDLRPVLEISGPFSLFRHTLLYGRSLAAVLPHLAWCARFELRATTRLWGRIVELALDSGAPIFPSAPPAAFDSRLEERLARDFARLAVDWDLLREPEPIPADGTLVFPDFLAQHRIHRERRVYIEVVGFWTPEYLEAKLARLRASGLHALVLCVDEERACGEVVVPESWSVVGFRRRVDAAAVLRAVERLAAPP
jgi:predicted nuclease of restriction endonuclease-like RecB superfamily